MCNHSNVSGQPRTSHSHQCNLIFCWFCQNVACHHCVALLCESARTRQLTGRSVLEMPSSRAALARLRRLSNSSRSSLSIRAGWATIGSICTIQLLRMSACVRLSVFRDRRGFARRGRTCASFACACVDVDLVRKRTLRVLHAWACHVSAHASRLSQASRDKVCFSSTRANASRALA